MMLLIIDFSRSFQCNLRAHMDVRREQPSVCMFLDTSVMHQLEAVDI